MSRVGFKLMWGKEEKLVQDVFIDRSICGKVAMTFTFNDNTIKKILIGDEEKADLFLGEMVQIHNEILRKAWESTDKMETLNLVISILSLMAQTAMAVSLVMIAMGLYGK